MITDQKTEQKFVDLLKEYEILGVHMDKTIAKTLDSLAYYKNFPLWFKIWRLDMSYKCLLLGIKLKKLYVHKKELLEGREELQSVLKRKG